MKNKLLFIVLIQVSVSFFTSSYVAEAATCNPLQDCLDAGMAGIKVADPTECHNYYLCINSVDENNKPIIVASDQPVKCDDGDYFSVNINVSSSDCQKEVSPCVTECANRECKTFCETDFETLAYPNNCSKYYVCVPGTEYVPTPVECTTEAPYFDGTTCGTNQYACCDICTPFCPDSNIEVLDPYNCEGYYLCRVENSRPPETDKFSCNDGFYFDPSAGLCQPKDGFDCKSLCFDNSTFVYDY